jgi:amino acid transporter
MKKKILATIFFLFIILATFAQSPEMYPPPVPEPVELTLFNIILYFVSPVALIVFYIFYRRSKRKKEKSHQQNSE